MSAKVNDIGQPFENILTNVGAEILLRYNTTQIPVTIKQNETAFGNRCISIVGSFGYYRRYKTHDICLFSILLELASKLRHFENDDFDKQLKYLT